MQPRLGLLAVLCLAWSTPLPAQPWAGLPVVEATVFKDGHVFVRREGPRPIDPQGRVVLDDLPAPVMGTFWPYSAAADRPLHSVVASVRNVVLDPSTLTLRDRLELNLGGEAFVRERAGAGYFATVVKVSGKDGAVALGDDGGPTRITDAQPRVYLQTATGVHGVLFEDLLEVAFKQDKAELPREESRNLLTLHLEPRPANPAQPVPVGMFYLQRGIRWIPSYKVDIDGKGKAQATMQATLINELTDLRDARVNLVVGVPSFAFQDTPDPMGVQGAVAQLSQHFGADTRQALSNSIMTQARMGERMRGAQAAPDAAAAAPELEGEARTEDLYVFHLDRVTLRRGERMVLTVARFDLAYQDVFKIDLPVLPPTEVWRSFNSEQQRQVARALAGPKALHVLRMVNTSKAPLTTAPTLILRDGGVLAQGLLAYTAPGATVDLPVTTAVEVSVKKTEREAQRIPNAEAWDGHQFFRVNLTGQLELTNRRPEAVKLEVVRHVVGIADSASAPGKAEMVNLLEADDYLGGDPWSERPLWWSWYGWPNWWHRFNGVGRFTWELTLEPGAATKLDYTWHYLWR